MLLVDRITEMDLGKRCVGYKNVTMNEAFFQGHYPGKPIMPGVLIVESMAQVGAVMLLSMPGFEGRVPLIGAMDQIKFRRPVVPGDQLTTVVEVLWTKGSVGKIKAVSTVDGEVAAEMEMIFKLRDKDR